MIWTSFHCSYSQGCVFMLCYLMARRRDAGPKCKTEIYCCGWFLKDINFYSPSVTLVCSQYPSVSCVINGVLKKQWTILQLFNLLLYFSFCISIIILQHLLVILSIINVLVIAQIAINSANSAITTNNTPQTSEKMKQSLSAYNFANSSLSWGCPRATCGSLGAKESISCTNTSAPGLTPALCLQLQTAVT